MAKQNGEQTAGKEEAIPQSPPADLEKRHSKLQAERRQLEAELIEIERKLRNAISNGDLASLDSLSARKAELPKLFIAASVAETTARHEIFNAEDQKNLKLLQAAEAERDKLRATFLKRHEEFEAEMAALKEQLHQAEDRFGTASMAIQASRNLSAHRDAEFKKALAELAGV